MTMTFFGKYKNPHSLPPAPPRRSDTTSEFGWPEEEFEDEEDGDMYEPPPCERPPLKFSPLPKQDNVYLERTPDPGVPQRQAVPSPRPQRELAKQLRKNCGKSDHKSNHRQPGTDQFHDDSIYKKPPKIDRSEKPGRKAKAPLPVQSAHTPTPTSNTEEDVYLDLNEDQDDDGDDELYLEPTAACPPVPSGVMRINPPSKPVIAPAPMQRMKPPFPRATSNFLFPLSDVKTAPSSDVRRASVPPPTHSIKPLLSAKMKELKAWSEVSLTNPQIGNVKTAAFSSAVRPTRQSGNEDKQWFAGYCTREIAEDLLLRVNKDGAFLIRYSSTQKTRQPYTLAVLYKEKVYNIHIRFLEEVQGYALGKDGKKNEEEKIFGSLEEIISYHKKNHLFLIDSKSQAKHLTYLTHPVRP
ncbi:LOW QUALITY PROTEIN: B-cell linker protein [Thalassophryne amazonica]|uniref:LOW QUALITY PROTEIN: B-cell linker protein n=1 Tax=Thalassophryne amazonica TaxID=390379 RepID=UPI0014710E88|nr:LOW QUALITY PROTEIN: B-cell linker protein [Thalassophryne amazonica]